MGRLAQLPSQGYRRTSQRGAILDILEDSGGHLTAAEIIDALADRQLPVNRSTVYRTLETLLDAGLVRASRLGRSTSYEVTHPEGEVEHHHLVCRDCHAMLHATGTGVTDILRTEAAQAGFKVEDVQLVATGLCRKCRRGRRRS